MNQSKSLCFRRPTDFVAALSQRLKPRFHVTAFTVLPSGVALQKLIPLANMFISPPVVKWSSCLFADLHPFILLWVKIGPPGIGPQVLVLVSMYRSGNLFWGYPVLTTTPTFGKELGVSPTVCCLKSKHGSQALPCWAICCRPHLRQAQEEAVAPVSPCQKRAAVIQKHEKILWMGEILHHLKNPGVMLPL